MTPRATISRKRLAALQDDMCRRLAAIDQIIMDVGMGQNASTSLPVAFSRHTTVVDWSEVHAFVCGSGIRPDDPLVYVLGEEDELAAQIADGAHQAALSFLFHQFPGPLILLPPHVLELQTFVDLAQKFVELNSVSNDVLHTLHGTISNKINAIKRIAELYRQHADRKDPSANDEVIRRLFSSLPDAQADEIRSYVTNYFAPMFLLGRWMSVSACRDLFRLLQRDRLCFLSDYKVCGQDGHRLIGTEDVHRLSQLTDDISFWVKELPDVAHKARTLVENDARALKYLQYLNVRLFEGGHQLLFMSRGIDVTEVVERYPEWFSCMADEYIEAFVPATRGGTSRVEDSRPDGMHTVPRIQRTWLYFLELGSAWERYRAADLVPRLTQRKEWIRSLLKPLMAMQSRGFEATVAKSVLQQYIDNLARQSENTLAGRSARHESLDPIRRGGKFNEDLDREPLLAFLRYVTNPDAFIQQRQMIRDQLEPELTRLTNLLPPAPQEEPSDIFKPLLRHVVEKVEAPILVEHIGDDTRRGLLEHLISHIRSGLRWAPDSKLSKALTSWRREREALAGGVPGTPSERQLSHTDALIHAMHAYAFNDFRKVLVLLPRRVLEKLPGRTELLGRLMVADSWLLDSQRMRRVDEVVEPLIVDLTTDHRSVQFATMNALLGMELDASDQHHEIYDSFRRSPDDGSLMLEKRYDQMRSLVATKQIPDQPRLRLSVINNLVYAAARLAFSQEDPALDEDDGEDERVRELLRECAGYAEELARSERVTGFDVQNVDTLAYYWYKIAIVTTETADRKAALNRALAYITRAAKDLAKTAGRMDRAQRLVSSHRSLIDSLARRLQETRT